jgi:uncharacterized membrane protein (UPF0127 family)
MLVIRTILFVALIGAALSGADVLYGAAADEDKDDAPVFATARICIFTPSDAVMLPVEIAADAAQRSYGLMDRDRLAPDAGMLFIFPEPQSGSNSFWMYRTRIPLDIAFIDADGVIASIRHMQPCLRHDPWKCPTYRADAIFKAALEVNQGFFAAHAIAPGDRLALAEAGACNASGGQQ